MLVIQLFTVGWIYKMANIIEITDLHNQFGKQIVHKNLNLKIPENSIFAIIGGSGSGKTTIFRNILMLLPPSSGTIKIFGEDLYNLSPQKLNKVRQRWGVMFQHSALFSGLSVLENVMFPVQELTELPKNIIEKIALLKLDLVGLPKDSYLKYPHELSGGMQRRAAAARALAMDPELLFLDEPTSGLDPLSARQFNKLLLFLKETLKLTIVIISHDIESLEYCTDKVAFIGDKHILAVAPVAKLMKMQDPLIADYFSKV